MKLKSIELIKTSLDSEKTQVALAFSIVVCLFLRAGFISTSVIVFFVYSLYCFYQQPGNLSQQLKEKRLLLFPIALFLLYVIWIAFTDYPKEGVTELLKKSPLLLIPVSFILIDRRFSERNFQFILNAFLGVCLIYSLICFGNAAINIYQNKTVVYGYYDHTYYFFMYYPLTEITGILPIYLGMYCNLAFIIVLNSSWIKSDVVRTLLAIYVAVFIILIGSKIGVIILAASTCVWIMIKANKRIRVFLILGSILLLVSVFNMPYFKDRFSISTKFDWAELDSGLWSSAAFRVAIWTCSLETIKNEPWLGYGTSGGQHALQNMYVEKNFARGVIDGYNSHNEFFTATLDLGITGFSCLLAMFAFATTSSLSSKDVLTLTFLLIIVATCLIESILLRQKGIVFCTFFYCLLLNQTAPRKLSREHLGN